MKRGLYLLMLVSISCGGKSGGDGPGLPACSRPATAVGCVATWTGVVSGSTSCTPFAATISGEWGFSADGFAPNTLFVLGASRACSSKAAAGLIPACRSASPSEA